MLGIWDIYNIKQKNHEISHRSLELREKECLLLGIAKRLLVNQFEAPSPPAEQIWMQNFWSESSWCSGYWKYRLWFCFMNTISKCAFCYSFKQQFFQHPGIRRDFPYIGNSKTSFVLKHILVCWSGILPHLVHFTMEVKEKENKCFERSWRKHVQLQSTRTLFQRKQKSQQIKVRQNYVGTPQDGLVLAVQKCLQTAQYSYIGELVTHWLTDSYALLKNTYLEQINPQI